MSRDRATVAVVGGGPSGLAAATALAQAGTGRVVVLEREGECGGTPRHSHHTGYGLRDLRRVLDGPGYAARWAARAAAAGAELRPSTQVTGWAADGALELTSPAGRGRLRARAVVLATGCRERPRAARLVPGARPLGVMTTGTLQQLVHLHAEVPGRRAVVVGAEHVSFSALLTLADAGARAVAMTTELPRHQTFAAFRAGAAARFRVLLHTRTVVTAIRGRRRVEGVELTDLASGATRELACDLVVFTADWIPDHELAALAGLELDPATKGPRVDPALRTSRPGVFAAGNLLHGAEPADVAAASGRHAAASVLRHLGGEPWPEAPVPIIVAPPLLWIAPSAVSASGGRAGPRGLRSLGPARALADRVGSGAFLVRAREHLMDPRLSIEQDGRELWSGRIARVMPGRSARLPAGWTAAVDAAAGPLVLRVVRARRRN